MRRGGMAAWPRRTRVAIVVVALAALFAAQLGHTQASAGGTVVAWGLNDYGQTSVPAGLDGVTAIAGGNRHSLALKGDGTVAAWGENVSGSATVPAGLSGVTALAGGFLRSLALVASDSTPPVVIPTVTGTLGQTAGTPAT